MTGGSVEDGVSGLGVASVALEAGSTATSPVRLGRIGLLILRCKNARFSWLRPDKTAANSSVESNCFAII